MPEEVTQVSTTTTPPPIGRLRATKAPALLETELPGGLHSVFVRQRALPLVEVRLVVPMAAAQIEKPTLTSVLSESMFAGTEHHDRLALAGEVEGLGGRLVARVDEDRLVVIGSVLAEHLGTLLGLLAEVLTTATYPDREVRADRDRSADEMVIALSQPEVVVQQALRRRMFASHPYATPLPTPTALRRVKASELRLLHPVLLSPSGAHLVLVGDFQVPRARGMVEEALSGWLGRRGRRRAQLPLVVPPKPGPLELVPREHSAQSNVRLGGSAPSLSDPGWPAASLAGSVLAGMFTSRITANLRERNGYSYSPRGRFRHVRAGSSYVLAADVASGVTAASLVEMIYELGRIATTGITEDELELARRHAVGIFSFETATLPGLASTLAGLASNNVGLDYLAKYPKAVIATTKDQVDEAARRYLAPHHLISVVAGDPEVVAPLSAITDVVVRSA
jgi:predicted Zn-dependent peptidase